VIVETVLVMNKCFCLCTQMFAKAFYLVYEVIYHVFCDDIYTLSIQLFQKKAFKE